MGNVKMFMDWELIFYHSDYESVCTLGVFGTASYGW